MTEDEKLEKRRAANRASYERNKESRLTKNREWRAQNPDRMKEYNRTWYTANREAALAKRKEYREKNPEKMKVLVRRWYLDNKTKTIGTARFQRTGCTPEQYQELFVQQDGRCAICQRLPGKQALHADHCHTLGIIRGLLCLSCNTGLGHFGDDAALLQKAIVYIKK